MFLIYSLLHIHLSMQTLRIVRLWAYTIDGKRGFEGWTLEHERQLCKFLDAANEHDAKFMLSYVVKVGEFTNTEIIEWTNKNKYHMDDVIAAQGRYNNRHEVLIKNY